MSRTHQYQIALTWTGNLGQGTSAYNSYERAHELKADQKPLIMGSSDPAFRGDPSKYNPEELFLSSICSCHMLWYLHLCSVNGIVVTKYEDRPIGVMSEEQDGSGRFTNVILKPLVVITDSSKKELARELHSRANTMCFIANSCNFKIAHEPIIEIGS